jgi:hypothetical protein
LVFRPFALRPDFALDMTDKQRQIMAGHAAHRQAALDSGDMVVSEPVLDSRGSVVTAVSTEAH